MVNPMATAIEKFTSFDLFFIGSSFVCYTKHVFNSSFFNKHQSRIFAMILCSDLQGF